MRKSKGIGEIMAGVVATLIIGTGSVVGNVFTAAVGYIHELHTLKIQAKKDFCTGGADCNLYYHFAGGKGEAPKLLPAPIQPAPQVFVTAPTPPNTDNHPALNVPIQLEPKP